MIKVANVGTFDRLARIIMGVILIALPYLYASAIWANPLWRWTVLIIGLVLVATALFRFCPLYRLIGVNTCKMR